MHGVSFISNYYKFVGLLMRNESVNDQEVKIKNHKFSSVNLPVGEEFSLAPKVV